MCGVCESEVGMLVEVVRSKEPNGLTHCKASDLLALRLCDALGVFVLSE
jgi:hypothetical protein